MLCVRAYGVLSACVEVEEVTAWKYKGAIVHGMDL